MYTFKLVFISYNLLMYLVLAVGQKVIPQDPVCSQPLVKNIPDDDMTTPGEQAVASGKEGKYARLHNTKAWCIPQIQGNQDVFRDNVYLEINLRQDKKITAIALQGDGRYGYGEAIKIFYEVAENNFLEKIIPVKNYNENRVEYVVLSQHMPDEVIITKKIRIQPQSGSNTKCLRLELYGCGADRRELEYYKCKVTNNELITDSVKRDITTTSITHGSLHQNDGEKLLFSEPYAWCVMKSRNPTDHYIEKAEVSFKEEYLIYGLQVDGYRRSVGVASTDYIPSHFKLEYALEKDGKKTWAFYNTGIAIPTEPYTSKQLSISPPLAAKFVRIYMRVNDTSTTCIKLQLYGCKASLTPGTVSPTTSVTNNTNATITTTITPKPTPEARIFFYAIPQGEAYSPSIVWKDTKYTREVNSKKMLMGGTGCLTDGTQTRVASPLKSPDCWVGWSKSNVTDPSIVIEMTYTTPITALVLSTYIDESIGASTIKRFTVLTNTELDSPVENKGHVCAPDNFYHISPTLVDFEIDLTGIKAHIVTLRMEYSGQWILVRQIGIKQGPVSPSALKLSKSAVQCKVPTKVPSSSGGENSINKILIVCLVIGLVLLFAVLGFLFYHYRTSIHKKFKTQTNGKPALLISTQYDKRHSNGSNGVNFVPGNKGYDKMTRQSAKGYNNANHRDSIDEDVYAAPELAVTNSDASLLLVDGPQYAQYNVISDQTDNPALYAAPNVKQYAEPNSAEPIYQASAIYASTYQNPFQAVASSSLVYADPSRVIGRQRSVRTFPREQLSFKEKIGVGQFGEVHIAEATGLDDIYGNIGHYTNSWGLPDTADVAVKVLKSDDESIQGEFMKEVEIMAELKHENVVRLLGVCDDKPMIMVCEYMENGDLHQFLRCRRPIDEQNIRASMIPEDALMLDSLLHMAQQIAAGMKYLHAEGFIHRDLASRNCLVGPAYQVKIADFGLSRNLYAKHYYRVEGKAVLPIRWMAPECLYYGKFTNQTDVWSFGVTLWEIFNFARDSPYTDLEDIQIIEAACESIQNPDLPFINLDQPAHCPDEVYSLMVKCWQKEPDKRPPFAHLNRRFVDLSASSEGDI